MPGKIGREVTFKRIHLPWVRISEGQLVDGMADIDTGGVSRDEVGIQAHPRVALPKMRKLLPHSRRNVLLRLFWQAPAYNH
jgi:hypothetical protein